MMETINYIQRSKLNNQNLSDEISSLIFQGRNSVFYRITELSAVDKTVERNIKKVDRIPFEDVLTGLHSANIPVAFFLNNQENQVSISIGTWADSGNELAVKSQVLQALLAGSFEYIKYEQVLYCPIKDFKKAGLVLGMPSSKIESDKSLPIDRLLQALSFYNWQCLILAEPNNDSSIDTQMSNLLGELRQVLTAVQDNKVPNPASDYYVELLKAGLKHYQTGKETGSWQTSVFLAGNETSYYQLAGLWKAVYSGEQSKPESIHVWEESKISILINNLQSLHNPGSPGDSVYKHPFEYKTILSSRQLSAYIHLPTVETPGISLIRTNEFDSVIRSTDEKNAVVIGNVIQRKKILDSVPYLLDVSTFSQHCFIPGMTGSGKTTTIFSILKGAHDKNVNFLVIESAKTEYRALLNDSVFKDSLQIFTLGNENVSPFRLNPFEVLPNIPVNVHLDLLRYVFSASFGMWTPLPQVLEKCLYQIYEDKGWDLTYNSNFRLENGEFTSLAFPTLTDLYNKVEIIVSELGYEDDVRDNIKASLLTRINSLRTGGKGNMLDTQISLPMEIIFERPTILELEGIGDDDDKAFIMGLLFIKMVEYRRGIEKDKRRQHILVIEEAHRLLTNTSKNTSSEEGNPKGKAVETFSNLLSEIRSYNQGVIIADQVPVKLAPDVIKNTNLKIAHRMVSSDDREVLAAAMAMSKEQANSFSTLNPGETIIFATGDDSPIKVNIINRKDELSIIIPTDETIRASMSSLKELPMFANAMTGIKADVDLSDPKIYLAEKAAKKIIEDKNSQLEFLKFIITISESDPNDDQANHISIQEGYQELRQRMRHYLDEKMDKLSFEIYAIINITAWYAFKLGTRRGWYLQVTNQFRDILQNLLFEIHDGDYTGLINFQSYFHDLNLRSFDPFSCCSFICSFEEPESGTCLYRFPVEEIIGNQLKEKSDVFIEAVIDCQEENNSVENTRIKSKLNSECSSIISSEIAAEAKRRILLCYAQHMLKDNTKVDNDALIRTISL